MHINYINYQFFLFLFYFFLYDGEPIFTLFFMLAGGKVSFTFVVRSGSYLEGDWFDKVALQSTYHWTVNPHFALSDSNKKYVAGGEAFEQLPKLQKQDGDAYSNKSSMINGRKKLNRLQMSHYQTTDIIVTSPKENPVKALQNGNNLRCWFYDKLELKFSRLGSQGLKSLRVDMVCTLADIKEDYLKQVALADDKSTTEAAAIFGRKALEKEDSEYKKLAKKCKEEKTMVINELTRKAQALKEIITEEKNQNKTKNKTKNQLGTDVEKTQSKSNKDTKLMGSLATTSASSSSLDSNFVSTVKPAHDNKNNKDLYLSLTLWYLQSKGLYGEMLQTVNKFVSAFSKEGNVPLDKKSAELRYRSPNDILETILTGNTYCNNSNCNLFSIIRLTIVFLMRKLHCRLFLNQ
ncbi:hypothetical protein RFI_26342, partial [Reticulomyxa filosa]